LKFELKMVTFALELTQAFSLRRLRCWLISLFITMYCTQADDIGLMTLHWRYTRVWSRRL